jgi:hypothetical protein
MEYLMHPVLWAYHYYHCNIVKYSNSSFIGCTQQVCATIACTQYNHTNTATTPYRGDYPSFPFNTHTTTWQAHHTPAVAASLRHAHPIAHPRRRQRPRSNRRLRTAHCAKPTRVAPTGAWLGRGPSAQRSLCQRHALARPRFWAATTMAASPCFGRGWNPPRGTRPPPGTCAHPPLCARRTERLGTHGRRGTTPCAAPPGWLP